MLLLMGNITTQWSTRSPSKSHLMLVGSTMSLAVGIEMQLNLSLLWGRGSHSSSSDVTWNEFWNASTRFLSKFLSYCYACKNCFHLNMLDISHKSMVKQGEEGWKCHIQHSLLPSAAKNLLSVELTWSALETSIYCFNYLHNHPTDLTPGFSAGVCRFLLRQLMSVKVWTQNTYLVWLFQIRSNLLFMFLFPLNSLSAVATHPFILPHEFLY